MYRATEAFHDAQDKSHLYQKGDIYPREGIRPLAERIAELAGAKNRRGIPLIAEIAEEEEVKKTAGKGKKEQKE